MEVVAATPGNGTVPPFHNHDVHEWSRIDSLTGCLERARLETDHWTATTQNSSHNYRKVVDSRARSRPDGHVQQEAKRQLEVFNSHVPGGRLQVIKSHTVSSSRWTSTTSPSTNPIEFDNLQLSINPIDLTTEKSKAHLSRYTRRPPSRTLLQTTAATNLYRVSQICNEFHNAALENVAFGTTKTTKTPVEERENGDGIEIVELENDSSSSNLTRSSSSNENLINLLTEQKPIKSSEDLEDLEQLQNWRRTSKIRRSLQFPKQNSKNYQKPDDLPQNTGSVRRIKEDLEKGRRLNAALRGNNFDFDALDQILQTINVDENKDISKGKEKESFVTVDSIKEMKGKLKKTPSFKKPEEEDDGIVTECSPKNNVRSYIYGMEKNGTGSLESRKHFLNKNEDWHNRRKSYGFEKVQQDETISNKSKSKVESSTDSGICRSSEIFPYSKKSSSKVNVNDFNNKKEGTTITIPIISKNSPLATRKKFFERELGDGISYSIESWKKMDPNEEIKRHSIAVDEMKYVNENQPRSFRRTSLAINTDDDDNLIRGRKKVEFCKTEVHFAAESGKVNIVETDEKPPPTNNFRRRRRYSGLIPNEEFNANGLPVFQFGDDQQIQNEDDESFQPTFGIVTVNNHTNCNENIEYIDEKDKNIENVESEAPKSILKNKPIKPKPYILGLETSLDYKNDYNKNEDLITPWGVKLRPVDSNPPIWRSTVTVRNTFYDQQQQEKQLQQQDNKYKSENLLNSIRIHSSTPNSVDSRSFCSVQDRIKQVEDLKIENKGYSTKINFGNGGSATIVERNGENHRNGLLNERIGANLRNERSGTFPRNEDGLKDNTTTTKITIDLNKRTASAASQPLKSTSLILNTLKTETTQHLHHHNHPHHHRNHNNRDEPIINRTESKLAVQQLEELKRLYEDVYSDDSETDKEVQSFMTKNLENGVEDGGSVVSGSWTRATAYKNISQYAQTCNVDEGKKRLHAQLEKDVNGLNNIIKVTPTIQQRYNNESKHYQDMSKKPLKPSSPGNTLQQHHQKASSSSKTTSLENSVRSSKPDHSVLRQPKKSEMAYFGVPISPQVTRRAERKDLRPEKSKAVKKIDSRETRETKEIKETRNHPPIYENVERINNNSSTKMSQIKLKREFDASILDELTKAADQILQAVNGYTDEDHKYTTTDDEKTKRRMEPLETISETKSWKQQNETKMKQKNLYNKQQKLSSSSVDSVNKEKHSMKSSTSSMERKKKSMESNSTKAITKARRLQRASSREALLQSHGSSSEDLAIEVPPLRKPRLIRKKITTASISLSGSSTEVKKKDKNKDNERLPLALPEIRHKTAVSTIRSTAEKAKDNKMKMTEHKKRPIKKDTKNEPVSSISTAHRPEFLNPHTEMFSSDDSVDDPHYTPNHEEHTSSSSENDEPSVELPLAINIPQQTSLRSFKKEKKTKRNLGQAYKTLKGKVISERKMKELLTCRMKCKERISLKDRQAIFNEYWRLGSYAKRSAYMASLIEIHDKATQRTRTLNPDNQKFRIKTYKYFIPIHGERKPLFKLHLVFTSIY